MAIVLTPELEKAIAEQARQKGLTPERLIADSLTYLFLDPEPSEEEEKWYKVQAQLMLDQIERLTAGTAQDGNEAVRREEREAHRAEWVAMSEEKNRLFDQLSRPVENSGIKDNREIEQELAELRLENERLCAEVGRKPGWLFSGKI